VPPRFPGCTPSKRLQLVQNATHMLVGNDIHLLTDSASGVMPSPGVGNHFY
jgi:hypothetical protein